MGRSNLTEIESSIRQLDVRDQVRLLQYLTPRIAEAVLAQRSETRAQPDPGAWRRFREIGDQLARTSIADAPSLTHAVGQMRR